MSKIPVETLCEVLIADFETGKLFWKERPSIYFSENAWNTAEQQARSWNTRYAGKQAFTARDKNGYFVGTIFDCMVKAHRVIWAMKHGEWPVHGIDHEDGNSSNNAIQNLRLADQSANMKNASMRKNNTSGVMGVSWDASKGKWAVTVKVAKKPKFIGRYSDKGQAIAARKMAEKQYGYHPNHGRRKTV